MQQSRITRIRWIIQAAYTKQEDEAKILQFPQKKAAKPLKAGGVNLNLKKK